MIAAQSDLVFEVCTTSSQEKIELKQIEKNSTCTGTEAHENETNPQRLPRGRSHDAHRESHRVNGTGSHQL